MVMWSKRAQPIGSEATAWRSLHTSNSRLQFLFMRHTMSPLSRFCLTSLQTRSRSLQLFMVSARTYSVEVGYYLMCRRTRFGLTCVVEFARFLLFFNNKKQQQRTKQTCYTRTFQRSLSIYAILKQNKSQQYSPVILLRNKSVIITVTRLSTPQI